MFIKKLNVHIELWQLAQCFVLWLVNTIADSVFDIQSIMKANKAISIVCFDQFFLFILTFFPFDIGVWSLEERIISLNSRFKISWEKLKEKRTYFVWQYTINLRDFVIWFQWINRTNERTRKKKYAKQIETKQFFFLLVCETRVKQCSILWIKICHDPRAFSIPWIRKDEKEID